MKKISETVVFFGSGPVAAKALSKLVEDFEVEAVITKPRPPHHQHDFPVLKVCEQNNLKYFTPRNKAELSELFKTKPVQSSVGVVIDYGILISNSVIEYFPFGIVNSHFSLLPKLRGADPISHTILNGDDETGVSLMLIVEALDEGPLLAQKSLTVSPKATTPTLTDSLIELSHGMLVETLPKYLGGEIKPSPQPDIEPSYSTKLDKSLSQLNWHKPAEQLEREVRAYIEWPRSRTNVAGYDIVVTEAHVATGKGKPGTLFLEDRLLGVFCARNVLIIDRLVTPGSKEMSALAFLVGHPNIK